MNQYIAWAAGLFEGNGYVTKDGKHPIVLLNHHDPTVIEQFALILDDAGVMATITGPYQRRKDSRPMWRWRANGWHNFEATFSLFQRWLGERKRERFEKILSKKPENVRRIRRRNNPNRITARRI